MVNYLKIDAIFYRRLLSVGFKLTSNPLAHRTPATLWRTA